MKVYLNGKVNEIKITSISTLSDVIVQMEKEIDKSQIITELKLNAKILGSDWYNNAKNIFLLDEDDLFITTQSSDFIAIQALTSSQKSFETITEDFQKVSDMFRFDNEIKANSYFAQCIDNFQWFLKIIADSLSLLGKNLSSIQLDDKNLEEKITELSSKLEEMIECQQNKDWILLADMIEYELLPLLKSLVTLYSTLNIN